MTACVICGCTEREPFYTGRIREGRFGEVSAEDCKSIEGGGCRARTLDNSQVEAKASIADLEKPVNVGVSLSLIEYVDRPEQFLSEIRQSLRPGKARLIISTLNVDALLTILPMVYPQFFYRRAHLGHWTADSLKRLLLRTGFSDAVISPVQGFGLGNFIGWLRDRSPQGGNSLRVVTFTADAERKAELQRVRGCDSLFASARA